MAEQRALIPLTDEDVKSRGKILARLTLELNGMKQEHAEERKGFKQNEDALKRRIDKLARSIREGTDEPDE